MKHFVSEKLMSVLNQHETTSCSFFQLTLLITQNAGHQQPLKGSRKKKITEKDHFESHGPQFFLQWSLQQDGPLPVISGVKTL